MGIIYTTEQVLWTITCGQCGIMYAMPDVYRRDLERTHKTFYCPRGHSRYFPNQSDEEKLRAQLASVREESDHYREQRNKLEKSNAAIRGHQTRLRKRIKAGCCPCCKRSFQNLQRHMKAKHPNYGGSR